MRSSYGIAACLMASCIALSAPASAAVTVTDRISNNGTDDIFFTYSGGAFSVEVDPDTTNGLADPEIFLFRDNGSLSGALTGMLVAHDDNGGPGMSSLISQNLAFGSYVLSVGTHNLTQAEARSGMADFTSMQRRFVATFSDGVRINAGPVPEPAAWTLMLAGFGAVGLAMRRRQKVSARVKFA